MYSSPDSLCHDGTTRLHEDRACGSAFSLSLLFSRISNRGGRIPPSQVDHSASYSSSLPAPKALVSLALVLLFPEVSHSRP
jgi:hypothetical protein